MKTENISLSDSEKVSVISNLNTMMIAGISIIDAVHSLTEDAKGNSKKLLVALEEDLMQGNHIYKTLSRFPKSFDKVTVSVIKASEEAGTLDQALADLATNIKKEMEFSGKIKSAMLYPMVIMVVFFGVLLMILVVVIPKISLVFSNLKMNLPLPTRILIFMSNAILNNTLLVVGGFIITITVLIILFKRFKSAFYNILYYLPIVGNLVTEIDLTRFSRNLYLLLNSGLPITTALDLSKDVVLNKKLAQTIDKSRAMILAGKKLSEGLAGSRKTFPIIMLKLIEVGEKSGSLPKALLDISEYLDYQVTETLKNVTVLLEPIMLVVVGVCVGAMMLAIIAPIYGMISQVGSIR